MLSGVTVLCLQGGTHPSGLPLLAILASLLIDLEYVSSIAALQKQRHTLRLAELLIQ